MQSKLYQDANMDIKIQRGLKILQFATQYHLRQIYYRNSPLNALNQQEQKLSSKAKAAQILKHNQMAEIMCQLNQQLLNYSQDNHHGISIDKSKKVSAVIQPKSFIAQSQKSISQQFQKSIKDSPQHSLLSLGELSNYVSQKSKTELKPIKEQVQPSQLSQKEPSIQASVLSNKTKKPKVQNIEVSKISAISNKKSKQQPVNDMSKSIKSSKKSKINILQESQIKSSHNLLDNNISKIGSNSSQILKSQQSKSNITQFELLKQLSQTFVDEQNIKMLLKLQNCELQQKYLQQRIINRLEKGYKDVNRIMDISWDSLKLPKMNYSFKRPNYAHTIQ